MASCMLPSQSDFGFLSVPDLQPGACAQDAMDHNAFSRGGSSSSQKAERQGQDAYVPVNYISPDAFAFLAAAEASADHRAEALGSEGMELDASGHGTTLQSALDGLYNPERILLSFAPPKRFFRTFWRSIAFRLVHRHSQQGRH